MIVKKRVFVNCKLSFGSLFWDFLLAVLRFAGGGGDDDDNDG